MTASISRTQKSLALVSLLAVNLLFANDQARARSEKHIVHVRLSRVEAQRAREKAQLASLDVMGLQQDRDVVDVRVTPSEMNALLGSGVDVSFAPQEALVPQAANLDRYLTPEATAARLRALESAHRGLARVFAFGKTREGRDLLAIEISRQSDDPAGKPAALFNSLHHARELMTTEVAVDIAETLLAGYGKDAEITRWLDTTRVVVVPQVNPDGNAFVHTQKPMWRKNMWRKNGQIVGVDLNRNYPALWGRCNGSSGSASSDTYRGPNAASEPETQAMMQLVNDVRPLVNISYHAYSELIIYPFGCRSEKNPSRDLFAGIGRRMSDGVEDDSGRKGTYEVGAAPDVIYSADGTDVDWQWKEAGVVSFAMEVGSSAQGFQPDYDKWRDVTVKRQRGAWMALLRAMADGTVTVRTQAALEGKVTARIERVADKARLGSAREAFDPDEPDRAFSAREVSLPSTATNGRAFAFLLPRGTFEITLTDAAGNVDVQTVQSRAF